ncbi:MAG TPA: C39 family peptidase [Gaiellales bacterium]|nr:C39 family peptidase [Gaiellales bacterium]
MITSGPVVVTIPARRRKLLEHASRKGRHRIVLAFLRRHERMTTPGWIVRMHWSRTDATRIEGAAIHGAPSIRLPNRVSAVALRLPVVRQAWRNDCEAASLSMMLGGRVGQRQLQRELPISRPFRPRIVDGRTVWGDPERGFVGDVRAGGYGVYDKPLLTLARRYDHGAENLTGGTVAAIVAALRAGRPIVAWIQLGPSAPWTWTSPTGRLIQANHAEHAVTLTGWSNGIISYHDPWTGTAATFPTATFSALWRTLGKRAIAGSSAIQRTSR